MVAFCLKTRILIDENGDFLPANAKCVDKQDFGRITRRVVSASPRHQTQPYCVFTVDSLVDSGVSSAVISRRSEPQNYISTIHSPRVIPWSFPEHTLRFARCRAASAGRQCAA